MIVRCPVCGTPFRHRAQAGMPAVGRCSVCDHVFPLGTPKRSYRIVEAGALGLALAARAGGGATRVHPMGGAAGGLLPGTPRDGAVPRRSGGKKDRTAAWLAVGAVLAAAGAVGGWYGGVHLDWPLREAALIGSLAGLLLGGLLARWMLPAKS